MNTRATTLTALTLIFLVTGCHPRSRFSHRIANDPLAAGDQLTPSQHELRGLPSLSSLPPATPEARGLPSVLNVIGPQKPHVTWNIPIPLDSSYIQRIGLDGTVYVSGYNGIAAVRDGKIQWAYAVRDGQEFGISKDGQLWFTKSGTERWFVLNRNGQGGLLPSTFKPPAEAQEPHRVGCSTDNREVTAYPLPLSIPLDYECTRPQAEWSADNKIYVGTNAPDVRAYTTAGALLWKLKVPCAPQTLLAGVSGRVFFSCEDNSINYIEKGALKWSQPGDGAIQRPNVIPQDSSIVGLMDRAGTLYYVDESQADSATHIHAITSTGDALWTIYTAGLSASTIQFDQKGRIYIGGRRGTSQRLFSIAD